MKGDSSLFRGVRKPHNAIIVAAVGTGLFAGFAYLFHIMKNDPTIVWTNKVNNPYPWLNISQNRNLKLYAVNNKFEDSSVKETFIDNKRPDA
ncbi:hypothetical protein HDV01_003814 [Terramyces sp. JEL0728]|nr:hypothetical protein HDV01_003814 [Terramyces sp. JEL0728]